MYESFSKECYQIQLCFKINFLSASSSLAKEIDPVEILKSILNKFAFQQDAYRPRVDRISQYALRRGGLLWGESAGGEWYPSMHWGRTPLPSVNRITDACKNITLPQLRCGR